MESGGRTMRTTTMTTTRRTRKMASAAATVGSVWESRMKTDQVKGGIKVLKGDEISPAHEAEDHHQPRNGPAAFAKRKALNSEKNTLAAVAAVAMDKSKSESESLQVDKCCIHVDSCYDCNDNKINGGCDSSVQTSRKTRCRDVNDQTQTQTGSPRPRPPSVRLKKTRSDPLKADSAYSSGTCDSQLRKLKSEPNRSAVIIQNSFNDEEICDHNCDTDTESNSNCSSQRGEDDPNNAISGPAAATPQSCEIDTKNNKVLEFNPLRVATVSKLDHDPIEGSLIPVNRIKMEANPLEQQQLQEEQVDLCKELGVCQDKDKDKEKEKVIDKVITSDHVNTNGDGDREFVSHERDEEIAMAVPVPVGAKSSNPVIPKTKSNMASSPLVLKSLRKCSGNTVKPLNKPILESKSPPPSPSPSPAQCKVSDEFCASREAHHSRLQSLVDLVMWRDVSRSAFVFGIGTFLIISSSFAKDLDISLISVASYSGLVYLAIVFLYRSIQCRGIVDEHNSPQINILGEEEALWLVKLVLPYLNESLFKLGELFSGDPAVTMKLALMLFLLARCGSSITIWKMVKLGFFGVFVIPKLCSSYSSQITAYGNFWVGRFQDAWQSCSHKKAVAFAVFMLVWNFSSLVARAWAVFMLFVAFRYYQQSLVAYHWAEDQTSLHDHLQQTHTRRYGRKSIPTSSYEKKGKKRF